MQFTTTNTSVRIPAVALRRPSSRTLWITQGILAAVFLFAGASKLVMPAADLQGDFPVWFMRFIGVCEVGGALGLILPGWLGIRRELTPLAAAGLVVIMIGATISTIAAGEGVLAALPFTVGCLAAFVARNRAR
jgi:hypothetical protein